MKNIFKLILAFVVFGLSIRVSMANHIQGGELGVSHVGGNNYKITLILYYDAYARITYNNTAPPDPSVDVSIFRLGTNRHVTDINLPLVDSTPIIYHSNCGGTNAQDTVRTLVIKYEKTVNFSSNTYNYQAGFYASWERCCRNSSTNNISSPGNTGMVFYCEFPAIVKSNGAGFINSNPILSAPNASFACVGDAYNFQFTATDLDGDQLKYSLVTPLAGSSSPTNTNPVPATSAPYNNVTWLGGYSATNQIPGTSNSWMTIDANTGQISLTPKKIGLFCYGIKVEEYRAGVKIGEVIRQFQLQVTACPLRPVPRQVLVPDTATNNLNDSTVSISYLSQRRARIRVNIKSGLPQGPTTNALVVNYKISVTPINFPTTGAYITDSLGQTINPNTVRTSASFKDDFFVRVSECLTSTASNPLKVLVQITDIVCPTNTSSSFVLNLIFPPAPPSKINVNLQTDSSILYANSILAGSNSINGKVGQAINFVTTASPVAHTDSAKPLEIRTFISNSNNFQNGKLVQTTTGVSKVISKYTFIPNCDDAARGTTYFMFISKIVVCGNTQYDTVYSKVVLAGRNTPATFTSTIPSFSPAISTYQLSLKPGDTLAFNNIGNNIDSTPMYIYFKPSNFNAAAFNFPALKINGKKHLEVPFNWIPACSMFNQQSNPLTFVVGLHDSICGTSDVHEFTVNLNLLDTAKTTFKTWNSLTANGDGLNDKLEGKTFLPDAHCSNKFEKVEIYSRWGIKVYENLNRDFVWDPADLPAGIYYVNVYHQGKQQKSWISVLK